MTELRFIIYVVSLRATVVYVLFPSNFFLCPLRRQITKSVTRSNFERMRKRRIEGNRGEDKRYVHGVIIVYSNPFETISIFVAIEVHQFDTVRLVDKQ